MAVLRPDLASRLVSGLTREKDRAILRATVDRGPAVDGIRGTRDLSVDGIEWDMHADVLKQLWMDYLELSRVWIVSTHQGYFLSTKKKLLFLGLFVIVFSNN